MKKPGKAVNGFVGLRDLRLTEKSIENISKGGEQGGRSRMKLLTH